MGFQVERTGILGCKALVDMLVQDLIDNGFSLIFPVGPWDGSTMDSAVLEAGPQVNANINEPWRIKIMNGTTASTSDLIIKMYAATPNQIQDTGVVTKLETGGSNESAGVLGTDISAGSPGADFFNMSDVTNAANIGSYPLSYQLTITDRGIALFLWMQASDTNGNRFSWVVIQRPVLHTDGSTVITGKAPVFCVYYNAFANNELVKKFVVRESDIMKPTVSVSATLNTEDSAAIINPENQVCIGEDNKYIVQFPNNLNTPRYKYTYELDMMGYTSADVVSQWADVPLRVYSEGADRVYKAMLANSPNNTGMRVLFLKSGGGV